MKYSQGLFSGHYQDRPRNSTAPEEKRLPWGFDMTEQDLLDATHPSSSDSDLASVLDKLHSSKIWASAILTSKLENASNPWRFDPSQNCSMSFPLEWTKMDTWLSATPCLQVNPKNRAKTLLCIPSGHLTNSSKKTPGKGNAVQH